jgi:hypothetical protein
MKKMLLPEGWPKIGATVYVELFPEESNYAVVSKLRDFIFTGNYDECVMLCELRKWHIYDDSNYMM